MLRSSKRKLIMFVWTLLLLLIFNYLRKTKLMDFDAYSYESSLSKGDFEQPYNWKESRSVDVAARLEERHRRVLEVCRHDNIKVKDIHPTAASRFVFPTMTDPTVLYCAIPRAGSMFMRQLIAKANDMPPKSVTWRDRFNRRFVKEGYDKAVMFMFTREPYSRLLSTYISKLWLPNHEYWLELGIYVVAETRDNATVEELACGHDVTFPELVGFLLQREASGGKVSGLFQPAYRWCEVCNYDYDYIGHAETYSEDAAYILGQTNVTSGPPKREELENSARDVVEDYVYHTFATITHIEKTECTNKYKLLLRAWRALQIRGLISSTIKFPLNWGEVQDLKRFEFYDVVIRAVDKTEALFRSWARSPTEPSRRISVRRSRAAQRRLALASAYSQVPASHRHRLGQLYDKDFKLFGYDPYLAEVFAPPANVDPAIFDLTTV